MEEVFAIVAIFVGLPWLILHYITKWKTAPTLTNDDEALLEELYQLARRLDDRIETVERLVAADNPEFTPRRIAARDEAVDPKLDELDRLLSRRTAK
ncbi:phage shock protein B [Novosphingobium kunmingense]|uniref:Phage shock protein B n=1 Tax=Novosphingobium kunmingense TaxID=1211806 RepID=A0A2N0H301_9SPHN|nr:envelope stress response membrane protein PspB [Novosphingobium kunmingense]PKB13322.1 phage shock protein B [Novosphingobium kunmingense]